MRRCCRSCEGFPGLQRLRWCRCTCSRTCVWLGFAFAAAVAHVTSSAAARAVFSREQFAREVRRLAVHCGVATLHHKLGDSPDIPEEEVIALFTDVRKLCETSI